MNTINRVQELADERGLTLCQLSKICDLSESTIRAAKKRGNQLSVDTIERICEALDISLSEFFAKPYPNKFAIRMSFYLHFRNHLIYPRQEKYWIPSRYPVFFECVKSLMTNTFASTTSSHGTSSSYGR